jgi:hypothetical protein
MAGVAKTIALGFLIGKYLETPLHSFVSANFRSPTRSQDAAPRQATLRA